MLRLKNGFTMVEFIIVLVIIGVLAGIAIPRFINQSTTARQNSITSLAAALSAASSANFEQRSANASAGYAISNCTGVGSANLIQGGLPAGYSITSASIIAGATVTCTLNGPSGTTANFVGLGIS